LQNVNSRSHWLWRREDVRCYERRQYVFCYERHWTPIHLDFVVSDLESAVRQAMDAGATVEGEIETHKWDHTTYSGDPFGHGTCFIDSRGRGYDEIVPCCH
jgi:hypothetical protein